MLAVALLMAVVSATALGLPAEVPGSPSKSPDATQGASDPDALHSTSPSALPSGSSPVLPSGSPSAQSSRSPSAQSSGSPSALPSGSPSAPPSKSSTRSPPGAAPGSARPSVTSRKPKKPLSKQQKQDRIVGGEEATLGQFPHQVSIRRAGWSHFCGGSIVSKAYVLTAAHCFDDKPGMWTELVVAAGTLTWKQLSPGGVDKKVESGSVHEKWVIGANKKWYDIAALKLAEPFTEWTDNIKPIPLNMKDENLKEGMDCDLSGWGRTVDSDQAPASEKLLYTTVQVKDIEKCKEKYGEQMGPGSVCAGYDPGGKDSCQGDSGGPMTCDGELAGIVSFGHGCAVAGFPGVYTAIPENLPWIREHTDVSGQATVTSSWVLQTAAMFIVARMISS